MSPIIRSERRREDAGVLRLSSFRMSACTVPRTVRTVRTATSQASGVSARPFSPRASACWSIAGGRTRARRRPLIVIETLVLVRSSRGEPLHVLERAHRHAASADLPQMSGLRRVLLQSHRVERGRAASLSCGRGGAGSCVGGLAANWRFGPRRAFEGRPRRVRERPRQALHQEEPQTSPAVGRGSATFRSASPRGCEAFRSRALLAHSEADRVGLARPCARASVDGAWLWGAGARARCRGDGPRTAAPPPTTRRVRVARAA